MADRSFPRYYASGNKACPTVTLCPDFDADKAAKELRDAMAGIGSDKMSIILTLSSCTTLQRQDVKKAYKANFGKDLIQDLKGELSGDFSKLVTYCLYPWSELHARRLFNAIDGMGTNEEIVLQTLCVLLPQEIEEVKKAYQEVLAEKNKASTRNLESDIEGDFSGDIKRLLIAVLQCQRNHLSQQDIDDYVEGRKELKDVIDIDQVVKDVETLYTSGEGKWGTDEGAFISILVNRNKFSLVEINKLYREKYNSSLIDVIKSETSGNLCKALKMLISSQLDPIGVYVKILRNAMEGAGTSDEILMSIIVDRCEIDLKNIMEAYEAETNEPLVKRIASETSGNYKKLLLCLCGESIST